MAKQLGVDWLTFSKWLWDTKFVPKGSEKKLANATGMGLEELLIQDWAGAKRHAQEVIKLRTDLAWPFAVTGWSSEREGHFQEAIAEYYVGLRALATTADFTEAWGITDSGRQKFVLNRLRSVPEIVDARIVQDEYVRAALNAESSAHEGGAIRTYWLHQGEKAEREGFYNQAYQYYYSAGWDRYCFDDMGIVLDALVRSATAAGWAALAKIAQLHLQSLSRK